jgi:hypothetical protein
MCPGASARHGAAGHGLPEQGLVTLLAFLVGGLAWYANRRGDLYVLPGEAVVGSAALAAAAEGGRFPGLRLPTGGVAVERRLLPLEPLPLDRVFPLGAAEVPWLPPQTGGVVDLARPWQRLLRERAAFTPWGPAEPGLLRQAQRLLPPRSTFRARGRDLEFLFPQLVPADRLHRLGDGFLRLGDRAAYQELAVERGEFRLACGEATAVFSRRPTGAWQVRCGEREASGADPVQALVACLEPIGPLWRLLPPAAESPLLIVAR